MLLTLLRLWLRYHGRKLWMDDYTVILAFIMDILNTLAIWVVWVETGRSEISIRCAHSVKLYMSRKKLAAGKTKGSVLVGIHPMVHTNLVCFFLALPSDEI